MLGWIAELLPLFFVRWVALRHCERMRLCGSSVVIVMVGKRREESAERASTPEYVYGSEYHGGRTLWHPPYLHDTAARNALLSRTGFDPLPHRSKECACINSNRADLRQLGEPEIARIEVLEADVGNVMFRAKRHGGRMAYGV